ncbi:hypothetical protein [Streptomyces sp. NPDC001307]|uniref:hypothetical protein n=1 Tax=Streptomyces sp. NPDC001307 TaxID=3364560 RepID=UPI00369A772D
MGKPMPEGVVVPQVEIHAVGTGAQDLAGFPLVGVGECRFGMWERMDIVGDLLILLGEGLAPAGVRLSEVGGASTLLR